MNGNFALKLPVWWDYFLGDPAAQTNTNQKLHICLLLLKKRTTIWTPAFYHPSPAFKLILIRNCWQIYWQPDALNTVGRVASKKDSWLLISSQLTFNKAKGCYSPVTQRWLTTWGKLNERQCVCVCLWSQENKKKGLRHLAVGNPAEFSTALASP